MKFNLARYHDDKSDLLNDQWQHEQLKSMLKSLDTIACPKQDSCTMDMGIGRSRYVLCRYLITIWLATRARTNTRPNLVLTQTTGKYKGLLASNNSMLSNLLDTCAAQVLSTLLKWKWSLYFTLLEYIWFEFTITQFRGCFISWCGYFFWAAGRHESTAIHHWSSWHHHS